MVVIEKYKVKKLNKFLATSGKLRKFSTGISDLTTLHLTITKLYYLVTRTSVCGWRNFSTSRYIKWYGQKLNHDLLIAKSNVLSTTEAAPTIHQSCSLH